MRTARLLSPRYRPSWGRSMSWWFFRTREDPWRDILAEQTPRPAFAEFAKSCLEKIAKGKGKPLKLDDL